MSKYQYENRPVALQIDLNQATYQAFLNCINSFQGLETESQMQSTQGISTSSMTSKVSIERFVYNLGILDGILGKKDKEKAEWKGGEFNPEDPNFKPFEYWAHVVKWLTDVGFFKQPRRIAHI